MPRKLPPSAYAVPRESGTARRTIVNPFGTARMRDWRMPDGGTQEGLDAARIQHELARQLRSALLVSEDGSIAGFARRHSEFTYERLRSILSGDAWMRLEDVATLARLLALDVSIRLTAESTET